MTFNPSEVRLCKVGRFGSDRVITVSDGFLDRIPVVTSHLPKGEHHASPLQVFDLKFTSGLFGIRTEDHEAAVILEAQASFFECDFSCLSKCRQQHSAHRQHGYAQQCRADRPLYKYQGIAAREQHGASEKLFH